jgi:hypothetical protein
VGEAGQEKIMYGIEETIARNGSTKADIEGGSFTLTSDGIRVPVFTGIAGEQIDSLECPESRTEERRAELRAALDALENQ